MVVSSRLPNAQPAAPFVTGLSLNLNGNAITVSNALFAEMTERDPEALAQKPLTARALRAVIAERARRDQEPLSFGVVFPFSSHNYLARYWLGSENIHPDRDLRMVTAPPPVLAEQLASGAIDAFCAGEPWNTYAEHIDAGRAILRSADIWRRSPEKALAVRERWAEGNSETHLALIAAVLDALDWLGTPENRETAAHALAAPDRLNLSGDLILPALAGEARSASILDAPDTLIFDSVTASAPRRSHALWLLSQMARWGQIDRPLDSYGTAELAFRPQLTRQAAARAGLPAPIVEPDLWREGARSFRRDAQEALFDGVAFDPLAVSLYLEQFKRHSLRIRPHEVHQVTETSII
jgi:ABC-type nitrate/sulfonate/bicarbonate transport system substrate-binding protein